MPASSLRGDHVPPEKKARDDLPGLVPRFAFATGPAPRWGGDSRKQRDGEHVVLVARLIQARMAHLRLDVDQLVGVPNELPRMIQETEWQELHERSWAEESLDRDLPDRTRGEVEAKREAGSEQGACGPFDVPHPVGPLSQFRR